MAKIEYTEVLTCKICGLQSPNLTHHVRGHKLTVDEYKKQYNVDKVVTSEYAREMVKRSNERWKDPEVWKNRSDGIKQSYTAELRTSRSEKAKRQWVTHGSGQGVEWNKVRKLLYVRAGSKCEICGVAEADLVKLGKPRLAAHEKNYDKIVPNLDDCMLLCSPCHGKQHRHFKENRYHQQVSHAVMGLLRSLKVDTKDENLLETPRRFASVLIEFSGLNVDKLSEIEEMYNSVYEHGGDGLIVEQNIRTYGLCPHHLLPVEYMVSLAYLPHGLAVGISKLNRLCEMLAKKFQLQEHYTRDIADYLVTFLKTPDVAVITKGVHMCIKIRGIKSPESELLVSEMRGAFRENQALRMELLTLLRLAK